MRIPTLLLMCILAAVACATPEVAEDYQAKSYIPAELAAALGGEEPARRADAARQVEEMPPADRLAALLELVRDDRPPVRLLAVGLLGRHHAGEPEATAGLSEVLSLDADADVRTAAVGALAKSSDADSMLALLGALSDDATLNVRRAAASALDRLTGQSFGGEFVDSFDDAEMAADDAAMSYEDWFDENGTVNQP